jgi:deazaflavin-dependent oxidoreductase (nitroreductase family)
MNSEQEWNQALIEEFRNNNGNVGGHFEGKTLLLLHTLGAKTGQKRITPVACVEDGNRLVIIASNSGSDSHPAWFYNLTASPLVTVEFRAETFQARATLAEEPERTRLYDKMVEMMPVFGEYRRQVARVIPVCVLTRVGG